MPLKLKIEHVDIDSIVPNTFNVNVVSSENNQKIEESIKRFGLFKPVMCRQVKKTVEIIGGEHRWRAAKRLGYVEIPIINLGEIGDTKAREISLADNERYGEDDDKLMEKLLNSLDTAHELSTFLPISDDEFDSFWSKTAIDLDDLSFDEDDEDEIIEKPTSSAPTHRVIRFKVSIEDAERLSDFIEATSKSNGFTTSDALTNAGDALIHNLKELW